MSKNQSKRKKPTPSPAPEPSPKKRGKLWFNIFAVVLALGTLTVIVTMSAEKQASNQLVNSPVVLTPPTSGIEAAETEEANAIGELHELLAVDPEKLGDIDIARMNLLCALGLPGAEGMDIEQELAVLDKWAAMVKFETDRDIHKFYADPGNFENSEGYYRILMLITVLQQDFEVRYNPDRIFSPDFTDCRDAFVNGLTQASTGEHAGGTCVSMPVVYVAVARRLGYPVKLATTREHVFARWEDEKDRFNIEATGQGLNTYSDDHYRTWPSTLTPKERASGAYLRSLTPAQELGLFMAARGYVLDDTDRKHEATVAYAYAHMLDPVSIDSFDNLGRSILRRLPEYPAVQERPQMGTTGRRTPPSRP